MAFVIIEGNVYDTLAVEKGNEVAAQIEVSGLCIILERAFDVKTKTEWKGDTIKIFVGAVSSDRADAIAQMLEMFATFNVKVQS